MVESPSHRLQILTENNCSMWGCKDAIDKAGFQIGINSILNNLEAVEEFIQLLQSHSWQELVDGKRLQELWQKTIVNYLSLLGERSTFRERNMLIALGMLEERHKHISHEIAMTKFVFEESEQIAFGD